MVEGRFHYLVTNLADGSVREFALRGWGISPSGRYFLHYHPGNGGGLAVQVSLVDTPGSHELMEHLKQGQRSPVLSPDEKWLALHTQNTPDTRQIWIVPFHFGRPATEPESIAVTTTATLNRNPAWSPDGNMLYWIGDRGGTRGIWAVKLDPITKRPQGKAFEIMMFPSVRRSMMRFGNTSNVQPAVAKDKIVFALGEESGNIWMTSGISAASAR